MMYDNDNAQQTTPSTGIRIGISSCLLGHNVRFDGGHKRNAFVDEMLSKYFHFMPVCPEMAIGLGVPRKTIRLVDTNGRIEAVGVDNRAFNVTGQLQHVGHSVADSLADISGYVLKKDSPSCGMERVKVYADNGMPQRRGRGVFAEVILTRHPNLPVEEEGRLQDAVLRENFIERVFIYHRWQVMEKVGISPAALVKFHTQHKHNILAHDEVCYRKLGRLVAMVKQYGIENVAADYVALMMQGLKKPATRQRHTNVLMHLMGHLKRKLNNSDKQEWLRILDAYRIGQMPLIVPMTMFKHYLRNHPQPYVEQQYYIDPYPGDLMLRNTI